MTPLFKTATLMATAGLVLTACNGGESLGGSGTGTFAVGITDAPADSALIEAVAVTVEALELQAHDGERTRIEFPDDPNTPDDERPTIVLTDYVDGARYELMNEELPAGVYDWMRLYLDADVDGDTTDSYVIESGATYELEVPSNANTGLKVNTPFEIVEGGTLDVTIDFDVRKSLHEPQNSPVTGERVFKLRPTLRLVKTLESDSIEGEVSETLLTSLGCDFTDEKGNSGAVYVYEGDISTPDDEGGAGANPLTVAYVKYKDSPAAGYYYNAEYLEAGEYTVALTCEAASDVLDQDDDIAFHTTLGHVTVVAGEDVVFNFD